MINDNKFTFLPHTADIKFQAFGKSLEEVFENSALALINIITKEKIKAIINKKIKAKGKDLEELLYNFLEEFLFLLDSKDFIFSKFKKIKVYKKNEYYNLSAEVLGDDIKNYRHEGDVKAITYHEMFVIKEKDNWKTQVVVDV
ncbi:MAG: archease [Nanoarchaeota archaeon]|nr:archease [Nanoarchaeota archaeon]